MAEGFTKTTTQNCLDCDISCRCGCQSNISLLPMEILERILWYEDPLTLTALERTSKLFRLIVSDFWKLYCKREKLLKKPTPLCSYYRDKGDGIYHSYDKSLQRMNDDRQRWRIMAIRVHLRSRGKCVVCYSFCKNTEHFIFGEDVLLCYRCLPNFSITITHNLLHTLNSAGIPNTQLHITFGTMLICQFIKVLQSSFPNCAEDVYDLIRPYLNQRTTQSLEIENKPSTLNMGSSPAVLLPKTSSMLADRYISNPRNCCCSVQQCSSAPSRSLVVADRMPLQKSRQRPFYIALGILIFLNFYLLIHAAVLMKFFKLINIIQDSMTSFVMVSFIDISLLVCFISYLAIIWYKRFRKLNWNQSFATILQCFLLACSLVEVNQSILTRMYVNNYNPTATSFLKDGIDKYSKSDEIRAKIDWIQNEFSCCGYSWNATKDWSNSSFVFPTSCCKLVFSNCTETVRYRNNCISVMSTTVKPILYSFLWTSLVIAVFRLFFLIYVCIVFYITPAVRSTNQDLIENVFTIT